MMLLYYCCPDGVSLISLVRKIRRLWCLGLFVLSIRSLGIILLGFISVGLRVFKVSASKFK